ncbi:MAG: outer membrane beta-barrel protein [Bacteroidia bacterium]|nr:outer membrane beta-barrel protein [Bacteroidia bacterium]
MTRYLLTLALCAYTAAFGQDEPEDTGLIISGYAEVYYIYDFNEPADNTRPGFIYSHNRHNEVTLNLGLLKASYNTTKVRANLALMAGTYANANLSAEPGVLKNIYEANIGVKISAATRCGSRRHFSIAHRFRKRRWQRLLDPHAQPDGREQPLL